jgi:hypothetical protein
MRNYVAQEYQARIDACVTPTAADVTSAKECILRVLVRSDSATRDELIAVVLSEAELPGQNDGQDAPLNLPPGGDPERLISREMTAIARIRTLRAARIALSELAAEGVAIPIFNPSNDNVQLSVQVGGTTGPYLIPARTPELGEAYVLPDAQRVAALPLLDASIYAQNLDDLLGQRGRRCIEEGLRAHRRGLHLAAVNMLGAASEAAWYSVGERCREQDTRLAKALDEEKTAQVISLTADLLGRVRIDGHSIRDTLDDLRSQAAHYRNLRNYGLHPRTDSSDEKEMHFTESAAALLFLTAHRYFSRLAEVARAIPVTPVPGA